ncbi:MAG TPA: carboxy terminal-processing peptidase, partial [Ohtaekwangia sp.]|nr:carboxy terminal-processing peptidase [Ohtaekwangia sp.]
KDGNGFVRITTDKIYRVTGKTAQGYGVKPDIHLPDVFQAVDYHEAKVPYALPSDSIVKRTFYRPLPDLPLEKLRRNSDSRMDADSSFNTVRRTLSWLEKEIARAFDPVALAWQDFSARADLNDKTYASLEAALNRNTASFEVHPNAMDRERIAADEFARDFNQKWINRLKSDIYVDEVFHIISDLVELTHKPPK